MAEMTVAEAKIFIAKELKALSGPEGCSVQTMQRNQEKRNSLWQIAALLESQAAEIGKLRDFRDNDMAEYAEAEKMIKKQQCCGICQHSRLDANWKALECGLKPSLKVSKIYNCEKWEMMK